MKEPDGTVYEGDIVNGKRHGRGTMKHVDGTVLDWEGNVCRFINPQN